MSENSNLSLVVPGSNETMKWDRFDGLSDDVLDAQKFGVDATH